MPRRSAVTSAPSISHFSAPSIGRYSAPSIGRYSTPSISHFSAPSIGRYSAPSISRGTIGTPLHTYTGGIRSGNTLQSPLMHSFSGSNSAGRGATLGGLGPAVRGGNVIGRGTNIGGRGTNIGGLTNNHPVNPQNWQHNANWSHGNQFADRGFGRGFDHGFDHRGFDRDFDRHGFFGGGFYGGYGGLGFYDPFLWDWPLYSGYGYGYGYPDYGYGYGIPDYGHGYGPSYGYSNYGPDYGYYDNGAYAAAMPADMTAYATPAGTTAYAAPADMSAYAAPTMDTPAVADEATSSADWGHQFIDSARQAFLKREYADTLRLASHASVETPKDPKVHELMALALFALKDYRGANMEAHAALSLAPAADWPTLYRYYEDLPTYEQQLKDLAAYIRAHQDAADARFVLAYHDLMLGDKNAAKIQFEKVLGKVPQDQLAVKLLKSVGGTPPANTAQALPGPLPASNVSQSSSPEKVVPAAPTK